MPSLQVNKGTNPKGKLSEMLGMSLGQGLGNGLNTYFANRSLDSLLRDKSLTDAPISKKLEAIRSALSPYGEKGQQIFQERMQIEQQEQNERATQKQEALQKVKGKLLQKYLGGGELSEQESELFTPKEWVDMHKAKGIDPFKAHQQKRLEYDSILKRYNSRIKEAQSELKEEYETGKRKEIQNTIKKLQKERDQLLNFTALEGFKDIGKEEKVKFDPENEEHKAKAIKLQAEGKSKDEIRKILSEEFEF